LAAIEHQTVMLINRQRASPETILRQGDDVLLLPFLGGG
jgi:molybdopterin converting factor small subunit